VAVAAVFLGRSFGLVAANRGVQLGGAYRLVRHPMYGAHALGYLGYVLTYPSAANVMVVGATLLLLNARAVAEERILARDPAYREYLQRLPWRFLPYVY
jgi:protein-S-isoprenylcysteine O-methyltransferase Ste14